MLKYLTGTLIIFFLFQGIAFADYYKWTDEQGNIHITDYPPPTETVKDSKVHKYESETNHSTSANSNEQKSSKSTKPSAKAQPTDSSAAQPIDPQEKSPAPYNCVKLCIQDSREARKACREDPSDRHNCMKRNKEQLDNCRKKCREEESYASSGYSNKKNNVGVSSNRPKKNTEKSVALLNTAKFELIDKRDPAEREGYPYPKSWFSYVMHGDRSLNVDRLSILQTKLIERFGSTLGGKKILLTQFYVMEKTVRPSFVKTPSGKQIANNGPFLPTLIAEVTMELEGDYFHGSAMLQLKQGSKSTHSSLTIATTMVVDDLLKDMERSWKPH
ncbi:MAG: DUF4124 domain-containing protein [Smithella sp.]